MSYKFLPPGRERRLAYDKDLRLRNRGNLHPLLRLPPLPSYPYLPTFDDIISVKVGLISKHLFDKSIVKTKKIQKNNLIKNENDKQSFCIICQDNIVENDIIRYLKCGHTFHLNCIDKWFSENSSCPQCRMCLSDK
jgi:hypothetical protein